MKLSEIMGPSRSKLRRANRHINSLIDDASELPREIYKISAVRTRSFAPLAKPDSYSAAYSPKRPVRDHFGSIMGDAVNNLRESLDYWMKNAIQCKCNKRLERVHFPFTKKRAELENSSSYKKIGHNFPEAARFISNNVEPCRDTNKYLWAVTSLCNENKHDDFLPTVTVVNIDNINIRAGSNEVTESRVQADATMPFSFFGCDMPMTIQGDYKAAVQLYFSEEAVFGKQEVIPTLKIMSQITSKTLDDLEKFIAPYCS